MVMSSLVMIPKLKKMPFALLVGFVLIIYGTFAFSHAHAGGHAEVNSEANSEFNAEEKALIPWNDKQAIQWFSESRYKTDFFALANHFESQNNKIYCGVASSVIVLNALRVRSGDKQGEKPMANSVLTEQDRQYISSFNPFFQRYTQDNIFTPSSKSKLEILGKPLGGKLDGKPIRDIGLQLEQLKQLLVSHHAKVEKIVANTAGGLKIFRDHLKNNLITDDDYMLVNYTRKPLGQQGGGHISPVGAYHEKSDRVLVMDVNSNKADWVWVSAERLYNAMASFDTRENRGYLLVSDK